MDAVEALTWPGRELVALYRRTGADVPFGDPLPSHGTEMEGWFWRLTDAASGRVVVALCSSNQHPDGHWSTSAIALEPGAAVRSAAINGVKADQRDFVVRANDGGDVLDADRSGLRLTIDDLTVNLTVDNTQPWPKAFGGGGVFSSVPFLNQYWQPYCLGGLASGTVKGPDVDWQFDEARLYCERNWGAGFPQRWWWGQAHDFGTDDVCVAFSGGLLELGPLAQEVTGVVVRLGPRVLRITPPAPMDYHFDRDNWHWRIRARTPQFAVELDGRGAAGAPHVLPVPLPAQRRNIDSDYEFLAGALRCTVRQWGKVIFDGTSPLAGLEIGDRPA
ncbi:tocopherol cyclase family protein [Mycolicibacterium senegalense]|uniref:tocopherol cyclase family protein n=1 Tax=Mycolicibacterium TaxID=1866885 RepID=UPI003204E504